MAVFTIARFEIRPEARDEAERAMHDYASYVRQELPGSSWTAYRDPHAPAHYLAMIRAEETTADRRRRDAPGTQAFDAALSTLLVGTVSVTECALVTSSDLQRRVPSRHRPVRRTRATR
jgi:quinol monooxygenase YgiN